MNKGNSPERDGSMTKINNEVTKTAESGVGSIPLSRIGGCVSQASDDQDRSFKLTGCHVIHLKGSWFIDKPEELKSYALLVSDLKTGMVTVADLLEGFVSAMKGCHYERDPQDALWANIGETAASLMCNVAKAIRNESHSFIKGQRGAGNSELESALRQFEEYFAAIIGRLPFGNIHGLCVHEGTRHLAHLVRQTRGCLLDFWDLINRLDSHGQTGVDAIDSSAEWVMDTMTQMFCDVARRSKDIPDASELRRLKQFEAAYKDVPSFGF